MDFYPGFQIIKETLPIGFTYGDGVFGPHPEIRRLEDIRSSLEDPSCSGPSDLYAIAMDIGQEEDRKQIVQQGLLFGAVVYSAGVIGKEPVRSQGHIHAVSRSCGYSTPEVYEIWDGEAIVYMQESGEDNPGKCYAVRAKAGDVVIVPPGWVHATVNADISRTMCFGAWCVRDYGFEYHAVRKHGGIAYFPYMVGKSLRWKENPTYSGGCFIEKAPREYVEFGISIGTPIYTQFIQHNDRFSFVSKPQNYKNIWEGFKP